MKELNAKYQTVLDNIKASIQNSDALKAYLEEEEDEQYNALKDAFEPSMHELYDQVARENPLQLEAFEKQLLDDGFEGLYLPKVLGYSVLRGKVNDKVKYSIPQSHFKDILIFIANSINFEQIKNRAGLSIQIGFALSSDIWISNLLDKVQNKKVRTYLESQKISKYRTEMGRRTALVKYRKQFKSLIFGSADFPKTVQDLKLNATSIKSFLRYRATRDFDNANIQDELSELVNNQALHGEKDFADLLMLVAMYFPEGKEQDITSCFNKLREEDSFDDWFFGNMLELQQEKTGISDKGYKNIGSNLSRTKHDKSTGFFNAMDTVLSKGFIHEDAIEAVRTYYNQNEGLSDENACVRGVILSLFSKFMENLPVEDFNEYFEINKTFSQYMDIFSNQKFNQDVKYLCLRYIKRLIKKYTDKRGKDYQDIKKFVKATFLDYGFMTDKQLVELFKTKRKKPAEAKA